MVALEFVDYYLIKIMNRVQKDKFLFTTGTGIDWVDAAPASAISGITIRDDGTVVGTANSISSV